MNNEPKADQLRRTLQTLESEEKKYGHTALPEKRLLRILGLEDAGKELSQNLAQSPLTKIRSSWDGGMMYSSQKAYTLEQQISQQLQRLVNTFISEKVASKITGASLRLGRKVRPSSEQIAAVNNMIENAVSVITGGPGTGKTTMVLGLVRALKGLGLSMTLCTPTGKAAKRLGEATGLQKFNPSTVHKHLLNESQGIAKRFDVMIVDEASMLDVGLFHNLISTIPDGARLVLIGDKNQLPPVAAGQPFKDIIETIERYQNYRPVDQGLGSDSSVNGIEAAAYDVLHGRQPNPSFN